jgi:DNA-binding transcriptional LysR family regulator
VELRQLRHFLALVEERSITRAAKRELIVQSGLSNSLQALERELGTPLYLRGTRPVRLTAAGEALVGPARRTVASAAEAEQAVHHTRDVLIGTLRVGIPLSAQHLVPFAAYLGEFTRDHPTRRSPARGYRAASYARSATGNCSSSSSARASASASPRSACRTRC